MRWTRHLSKLGNLNCLELLQRQFTEIKSRFSFWILLSFLKQNCFQITGWRRSTNCECCRSWWAYCQTKHFWLPKWNLPGCLETIHRWRTFHQRYSQRHSYSTIPVQGKFGILLPKLFLPTVRKNCSSDWEKLLKFEAEC